MSPNSQILARNGPKSALSIAFGPLARPKRESILGSFWAQNRQCLDKLGILASPNSAKIGKFWAKIWPKVSRSGLERALSRPGFGWVGKFASQISGPKMA